jgi:hypothetical protein
LEQPLQVVHREAELPFEEHDWRAEPNATQELRLREFLRADRARGFVLSRAPLLRLSLIRISEDTCDAIWTCHHIVMDGWSMSIVLQEVLALYEAACEGRNLRLPPCAPYRDYVAWLQAQDMLEAEMFWKQTLGNVRSPTPLGIDSLRSGADKAGEAPSSSFAERENRLGAEAITELQHFVRSHQLTLSTVVQAAWAVLLSRYSGQSEVVFGTTVSGRPANLAGVEAMVGLFINTLPVRVPVPGDAQVLPWLQEVQSRMLELREFEYSPLVRIHEWSALSRGEPLFESAVVFENFPFDAEALARSRAATIESVQLLEQTNVPLTLYVVPGSELLLRLAYDEQRFEAAAIERLLGHLGTLLSALAGRTDRRIEELPMLTAAEQEQLLRGFSGMRPQPDAHLDAGRILGAIDALSDAELDRLLGTLLMEPEGDCS